MSPAPLRAESISGTVRDTSGAVIAGAQIEISGGDLPQTVALATDASGHFESANLKPGTYLVRVSRDGFAPLAKSVELQGGQQLELTLQVAEQRTTVQVSGTGFANSDPVYRQLRNIGLGQTFRFDNFTLLWDAATFHFEKGTLTFLAPINGVATGAILSAMVILVLSP